VLGQGDVEGRADPSTSTRHQDAQVREGEGLVLLLREDAGETEAGGLAVESRKHVKRPTEPQRQKAEVLDGGLEERVDAGPQRDDPLEVSFP
jgi:hypothetical protein